MRNENVVIFEVDHQFLKDHPNRLRSLAELYCRTWMFDENFQEYRQCPVCKQYFSHEQVEISGIKQCENPNHDLVDLIPAWDVDQEMAKILEHASDSDTYRVLAVDTQTNEIVGFAWGRMIDWEEIYDNWGESIITELQKCTNLTQVAYFDELGVDRPYRNQGIGKEMARWVCRWMQKNFPNHMGLLRTHQNSPARPIYQSIGYTIFAEDTQYGGGRVMMWANPTASLNL